MMPRPLIVATLPDDDASAASPPDITADRHSPFFAIYGVHAASLTPLSAITPLS